MRIHQRPKVIVNFAVTADGKVSTRCLTPSGFASAADKTRFRHIRSLGDGLMVGVGTVAKDTMSMGLSDQKLQIARLNRGQTREPVRILLSNSGRINPGWKVFQNARSPLVIFSTRDLPAKLRNQLPDFCDIWRFESSRVPLRSVLAILKHEYRLNSVVCEGGPRLLSSLVEENCVDELFLTLAPRIFGGTQAPTLTGRPGGFFLKAPTFRLIEAKQKCDEFFAHFVAQRSKIS